MSLAMPGAGAGAYAGAGTASVALRPGLWLALLAAGVLTAVALWMAPDQAPGLRTTAGAGIAPGPTAAPAAPASPTTSAAGPLAGATQPHFGLPAVLESVALEAAEHDPFVGQAPALPRAPIQSARSNAVQATPITTALTSPQPVPAAAPIAPALSYRFFARLTNPAGTALTFVAKGDQVLQVQAGMRLDVGYVVESVDEHAVHLHYPPLDVRAVIAIPPASMAPLNAGAR